MIHLELYTIGVFSLFFLIITLFLLSKQTDKTGVAVTTLQCLSHITVLTIVAKGLGFIS